MRRDRRAKSAAPFRRAAKVPSLPSSGAGVHPVAYMHRLLANAESELFVIGAASENGIARYSNDVQWSNFGGIRCFPVPILAESQIRPFGDLAESQLRFVSHAAWRQGTAIWQIQARTFETGVLVTE